MRQTGLLLGLCLCPLVASAGFFDDALNTVKQTAEDAYDQTVGTVNEAIDQLEDQSTEEDSSPPPKPQPAPEPEPAKPAPTASTAQEQVVSKPAKKAVSDSKYIELQEISTDRRPATPASIGLTRLRYDQGWLDKETLEQLTEGVIYCQQNMIKPLGYLTGCLGERYINSKNKPAVRVVPVFQPAEIDGKNRKFVAAANPDRLKPVLIDLANHLPPEFGNTVGWRGEYDFDEQVLKIKIWGMEKAEPYHLGRIPKHLAHMDVYKLSDRDGGYYPMKPFIPGGLANGILALVFDRNLSEGRVPMPPSEAEPLFENQTGNTIGGTAVVEFAVNKTEDNAAIATLEEVKILSAGKEVNPLKQPAPIMTLPATAFPKISAAAPVPVAATPSKPKPAPELPAPKPVVEQAPTDPYLRANTGQAFGPDVIDLKLGMTFDEADKHLRKHKSVMNVIEGKPPRPFTIARLYIFEPGDEYIGLLGLDTASGQRVATIDRTIYFDPDNSPSQTAIAASVEKKYGVPSYKYETKGNFNRNWYTDPDSKPTKKSNAETRACEKALGGSSNDTWLVNGKTYQWTMPWREKTYMGVRSSVVVGNHKDLENDKPSECGPAIRTNYNDGSGMLTGASLHILLYDPAWIIADSKKMEASDAKKGAEGLDL